MVAGVVHSHSGSEQTRPLNGVIRKWTHRWHKPSGAGGAGAAKPTAELLKEFTLRIFGPPADEIGKLLATPFARLNERRAARAVALIAGAATVVTGTDTEPQRVPDHLLLPLSTHGSSIDDSDLQAVWAQLLASAATDAAAVWPAFPQILSELSAKDVVSLSGLIDGRELEHYERLGDLPGVFRTSGSLRE